MQRGAGRFLLCRSSADDHISSVVTNVITYGCSWARICMQGSLGVRGGCLSCPAAQFKGFVSLEGVWRPTEINFGASCVGNLTTSRSSSWLVVSWNVCLIRNRHPTCHESSDVTAHNRSRVCEKKQYLLCLRQHIVIQTDKQSLH